MILVDISDERFWNILFDEAYVEGQQAERIENELKKIIAYDLEDVVKQLEVKARFYNSASSIDQNIRTGVLLAIQIVKEGGVKHG